ncbi:hypothetical protein F383_27507 [Gossypium arboreum]|nr:hypothetical protein F383_39395 [Gossypium arboreum]KHG22342.1 hypothetical protein F383_27507 [Gossypium arboreum]
MASLCL